MRKIRVGVIGCGKIAQVRHLPEYAANPNCVISGVYDINQERAQEIAQLYGAKCYDTYKALLENPDIDAVSVCTANHVHAEISIAALNSGKDVLCEKPMAITLAQCEAMVEAAQKYGKRLMIGHNQRFAKAHIFARDLIRNNEIGKILTFRTTFGHGGPETWSVDAGKNVWFFDKNKAAMGAMADLGIHKTDLIQYLTDQNVTEVCALTTTLDKRGVDGQLIGVDDNAICIYRLNGGAVGTMSASWTYYSDEDNSTVLYGTEGVIRIYSDPKYSVIVENRNGEKRAYSLDQIQTNENQANSGVIDAWVECLVNGTEPSIPGDQALAAMRAVFAAIKSAEEGRIIKV